MKLQELLDQIQMKHVELTHSSQDTIFNPIESSASLMAQVGVAARYALDNHFAIPENDGVGDAHKTLQAWRLDQFRNELIKLAARAIQLHQNSSQDSPENNRKN